MALDQDKMNELEAWKDLYPGLKDRLNNADKKLNDLFAKYPAPPTAGFEAKADFVLSGMSDAKEEENFKKEFNSAIKYSEMTKNSVAEKAINISTWGADIISKLNLEIREAELSIEKEINEKASLENEIEDLKEKEKKTSELFSNKDKETQEIDAEISKLEQQKVELENKKIATTQKMQEIQDKMTACGPDDKAEYKRLSKESKKIENDLVGIDNEMSGVDDKIIELDFSKKLLSDELKALQEESRDILNVISGKQKDLLAKDSEINNSKKIVEEYKNKLDPISKSFEEDTKKISESLEAEGININVDIAEEELNQTPINNSQQTADSNINNNNRVSQVVGSQSASTNQPVTAVVPADKKKAALDYLIGGYEDSIGLSPKERIDRIKSSLSGRDYEQMLLAYKDLSDPNINLSRQEKNKLKSIMRDDKEKLLESMQDLSEDKFSKLAKVLGVDDAKIGEVYESFNVIGKNSKVKESQAMNGLSMSKDNKALVVDMLENYYEKKNNNEISQEQIEDIEKYIVTQTKLGTLEKNGIKAYGSFLDKFSDKVEDFLNGGRKAGKQKVENIQAIIAKNEIPEEKTETNKTMTFAEGFKNMLNSEPGKYRLTAVPVKSKEAGVR